MQISRTRNWRRAPLLSALFSAAVLFGLVAPAHAYPITTWIHCHESGVSCSTSSYGYADGSFTWYNRTAYVSGDVHRKNATFVSNPDGSIGQVQGVQVAFEAYAPGGIKVDTQTRTVNPPDSSLHYGFTIGDTNLAGGIERIKVTICIYSPARWCGAPRNYYSI